jgi:hypothetical protein
MGAVGTDVVVSLTNDDYAVFRKSDRTRLASDTMTGFWTAAGAPDEFAGPIDPRLLYDPGNGRFFAAAIWNSDTPPSGRVLLAVSKTADPLDGWTGFAIPTSEGFISDQPMIGLDDEALYATAGLGISNDVFVFPKDDLVATPASIEHATLFGNVPAGRSGFQPAPVTTLDGGGLPTKLLAAGTSYFAWSSPRPCRDPWPCRRSAQTHRFSSRRIPKPPTPSSPEMRH